MIVTDKALKGFDEMLESDLPRKDWLTNDAVINYHEKIKFSDDEEEETQQLSAKEDLIKRSTGERSRDLNAPIERVRLRKTAFFEC